MMSNEQILELARQEHIKLVVENSRLESENNRLKRGKSLAHEAINKFCPPNMYAGAMEWLKEKDTP
jgi:hypothetical protein